MPTFRAFSARALEQAADPMAAAKANGSARPQSPVRAILGPGTGPLAAPNGARQDATDDDVSSVGQEEVEARQRYLDESSAEWLAATALGIYNEAGEELFSDHTFRPAAAPPARGPVTQHFDIGSDADEGGAAAPSGSRKRTSEEGARSGRSTSPRRSRPGDDSCPELMDGSPSPPASPRTPVRIIVSR